MTAAPGPAGATDADLVARVLAADREAFAAVYDRYGTRLYDFAYSMLRHPEDAADAVADSFVKFAERLSQLREPDRLRPWLYAIVRSECLRRLKARKRVAFGDEDQLIEMADDAITPEESAERAALQKLVWDASAGLADRDRALLDLHLRQGLEGAELGEAMGVSAANAYVMLNRLRAQVDRSLGALLIARLGRDDCEDLDIVLADWDGGFSPLVRKRVARHVDRCEVCSERRKRIVSPWALLAAVPVFTAPLTLRDRVLNDTQLVAHHVGPGGPGGGATSVGGHRWSGSRVPMAAAALVVLAILATVMLWPGPDAVEPLQATPSAPATTLPGTPAATLSPAPATAGTTDVTTSPSTTPTPSPTPTSSPSGSATQLPGSLSVSTRAIDLGQGASRATVVLTNTGDLPLGYRVTPQAGWLTASPAAGELGGGQRKSLVVLADRSQVREGTSTDSLVITWDRGSIAVQVSLREERAPVVSAPRLAAGTSCEVNTVLVSVTDESRVVSVNLTWSGPSGRGSARMAHRTGTQWAADMGRFRTGGDTTLRVVATDSRGNTGTGSAIVVVYPCRASPK